jgi:broad specificity phosphatase PhoE
MSILYHGDLPPPKRITLMRHEQSVANLASLLAKQGDLSWSRAIVGFPDEQIPLTKTGEHRCSYDGEFVRRWIAQSFDAYCVSPAERSLQTAFGLGFTGAAWDVREELVERRMGHLIVPRHLRDNQPYRDFYEAYMRDPLSAPEGGGESIAKVQSRFLEILLHYQGYGSVFCLTHANTMVAAMSFIENWDSQQFTVHFQNRSQSPTWLDNGHIVQYSRVNPLDPSDVRPTYCWVRSTCPWKPTIFTWKNFTCSTVPTIRGNCLDHAQSKIIRESVAV